MKQYLLVVNFAPVSLFDAVLSLRKRPDFKDLSLLILTESPDEYANDYIDEFRDHVVRCDFNSDASIASALKPYLSDIKGVICRGDKFIQDLRRVIPFLPPNVLVSTPESLRSATNKHLMRADFEQHYPEITPHYVEIHDDSDDTIARIEAYLSYPVIVKPANLASSLLVQSCQDRGHLKRTLVNLFHSIDAAYEAEGRRDKPQVIVEEYLEGDFYSIDVYVMGPGQLYCCPPVAYIPAKQLGVDDFFLYKRFIPTKLTNEEVAIANDVARKAIESVGLTHTTVHVEVINTTGGWRVIELGPRLGNFRDVMYKQTYDIDHALNDVLVRLGVKPQLHTTPIGHSAAYSVYPEREGTLRQISGLDHLQTMPEVSYFRVRSEPGNHCKFAKNGGHSLAEFIIFSKDKTAFDSATYFVERNVKAIID